MQHNILYKNGLTHQILRITCDNASPNDMMVEALAKLFRHFPDPAN